MSAAAGTFVKAALALVETELKQTGREGKDLRERDDIDPAIKRACQELTGGPVYGKGLATEHFGGIGPVDVFILEPAVLIEVKWSYDETRSKIFESVWDAIKLALLAAEPPARLHPDLDHPPDAFLATGASIEAWKASESKDLFESGVIDPREMWERPLVPPGPNSGTTVGEDVVLGNPSHSQPTAAPKRLAVERIETIPVRGDYELRVIRVAAEGPVEPWWSSAPR